MSEPRTRAAVLATGLVQVVATPDELSARVNGWWAEPKRMQEYAATFDKPAYRTSLSDAPTKWQKPPAKIAFSSLPGGTAPVWMNGRAHGQDCEGDVRVLSNDYSHRVTAVPDMTQRQREAALDAELRRLAGAELLMMEPREVKVRVWEPGTGYVDETELRDVVAEAFCGKDAAEQFVLWRRSQLSLADATAAW